MPEARERKSLGSRLRGLVAQGLEPRQVGWAAGVGAAIGVSPLIGLQTVSCCLASWGLRLNLPVLILAANISLGPLLVGWAGLEAGLGRFLRLGLPPRQTYDSFVADAHGAGDGLMPFLRVLRGFLGDWLLGSALLMPIVGLLVGLLGWAIAGLWQRRRRAEAG